MKMDFGITKSINKHIGCLTRLGMSVTTQGGSGRQSFLVHDDCVLVLDDKLQVKTKYFGFWTTVERGYIQIRRRK